MYEGYLTEDKIGEVLDKMEIPYLREYKVEGTKKRADYFIPEYNMFIEFDGPRHFTSTKTILMDIEKDIRAEELGIVMVRIPYFMQLSLGLITKLFGPEKAKMCGENPKYPHGFIDTKLLPYDFCSLGVVSFHKYLDSQGIYWREQVFKSLENKPMLGLPLETIKSYVRSGLKHHQAGFFREHFGQRRIP